MTVTLPEFIVSACKQWLTNNTAETLEKFFEINPSFKPNKKIFDWLEDPDNKDKLYYAILTGDYVEEKPPRFACCVKVYGSPGKVMNAYWLEKYDCSDGGAEVVLNPFSVKYMPEEGAGLEDHLFTQEELDRHVPWASNNKHIDIYPEEVFTK